MSYFIDVENFNEYEGYDLVYVCVCYSVNEDVILYVWVNNVFDMDYVECVDFISFIGFCYFFGWFWNFMIMVLFML